MMETLQRRLLRPLLALLLLNLLLPIHAVYFYIENASPKCFYEELPKDTLVVGLSIHLPPGLLPPSPSRSLLTPSSPGHYKAEQYDPNAHAFTTKDDLGIAITVDETFDNDHRVVSTKGGSTGKFTFTAADAGDHRICFTPSHPGAGGWLNSGQPVGGIKLTLDIAIGETSTIESTDKGKMSEIAQKVKDLHARLQDIRREQVFQRVSSGSFFGP